MDGILNSDFVVGAAFADAYGPRSGLADTFICTVTNVLTGAVIATPTVTENPVGAGLYEATVDSSYLTSRIRIKVVFANTSAELYNEAVYDIGVMPIWSMVRSQLRWDIEARLHDGDRVWQEMTTRAGTTSTAVLGAMTIGADNEYRGLWAWFNTGDNAHRERRVTAYDAETTTITFSPSVPVPVGQGVTVELAPMRPSLVNAAIDRAYRRLAGKALNPVEFRFATDGLTTEWPLDASVYSIHNVGLIRDEDGQFLGWFQQSAWQLMSPRILRLAGPWNESSQSPFDRPFYASANALDAGYHLRVMGHEIAAPPLYDSSAIVIDPDAVAAMAIYDLSAMLPSRKDRLPLLRQDSEAAYARAATPWPAGSKEVPS